MCTTCQHSYNIYMTVVWCGCRKVMMYNNYVVCIQFDIHVQMSIVWRHEKGNLQFMPGM